jgi:hypothetical protein
MTMQITGPYDANSTRVRGLYETQRVIFKAGAYIMKNQGEAAAVLFHTRATLLVMDWVAAQRSPTLRAPDLGLEIDIICREHGVAIKKTSAGNSEDLEPVSPLPS